MKNTAVVLLCILIACNIAYSQKKKKYPTAHEKFFFGLTVGPSFPQSDFANKDYTESSGYANVGYKIQGFGGVNIIGAFGITLLGFFNHNTTDPESLLQAVKNAYPGHDWVANSKSWELYGGLGGISFYYPLSRAVSVDFKILSGLLSSNSPQLLFESGGNTYTLESSTANSFSYMTSLGLNFFVGQNVSLTAAADFMRSEPNFVDVKTAINIDGNTSETFSTFYREMDIINVNIGFRYSIR